MKHKTKSKEARRKKIRELMREIRSSNNAEKNQNSKSCIASESGLSTLNGNTLLSDNKAVKEEQNIDSSDSSEICLNKCKYLFEEKQETEKSSLPHAHKFALDATFGTIHQASLNFPEFSRGMQCTCNALMSLIFLERHTGLLPIDRIMLLGDDLYITRVAELQSTAAFVSKMLNFDELPRSVSIEKDSFDVTYHQTLSGTLTHITWDNENDSLNLEQGIQNLFSNHRFGLVIVGGLCSAVYKNNNGQLVFFDSHSHGPDGLSTVDGKAVQVTFQSTDSLIIYLFSFYQSCNISVTAVFELQPISFECKYLQQEKRMKPYFEVDLKTNASGTNSMQKYFEHQDLMQKMHAENEKKVKYMKEYMMCRRKSTDFQNLDKARSIKSKHKARQYSEFRKKEMLAKRMKRMEENAKEKERAITLKSKKKARQVTEFREKELKAKHDKRKDEKTKEKERTSTSKCMKKVRQVTEFRENEMQNKRRKREDPTFKEKERLKALEHKRALRITSGQLAHERLLKQASKQKKFDVETEKQKLGNLQKKVTVPKLTKRRSTSHSIAECISKFHEKTSEGPVYVCTCCHQTWFRRTVSKLANVSISKESKTYCTNFKSVNEEEWICITCLTALRENKIPRLSAANGMKWPEKPSELNLHPLEERLISQRIPFMHFGELPKGGQLSAKGNIVNVPVDIQPTINMLPRQLDENVSIAVKLKKRMSHKSATFTENVRPTAVMNALDWLVKNSELYKHSDIKINTNWKNDMLSSTDETVKEYIGHKTRTDAGGVETVNDDFCEVSNDQCVQGNADTLVEDADVDTNKVHVFAPGENQKPLSLYEDKMQNFCVFHPSFVVRQECKMKSDIFLFTIVIL